MLCRWRLSQYGGTIAVTFISQKALHKDRYVPCWFSLMEKSRELNPLTFGPYEFANGSVAKGELDPTCDGGFLCRDLFGVLSAFCMYTELGVQLNTQTRLKAVREIRKWGTGLARWERRIWFSNINSKLPAIASLRCAAKVRAEQYSADVFLPAFVICLLFSSLHHRAQCAFWLIKTYACTFWRVARTEMDIVDEKKKAFFFFCGQMQCSPESLATTHKILAIWIWQASMSSLSQCSPVDSQSPYWGRKWVFSNMKPNSVNSLLPVISKD